MIVEITPEDKAEELVEKFKTCTRSEIDPGLMIYEAKQCALVCVNEILSLFDEDMQDFDSVKYWSKVKQEIEKL